MPKVKESEIAKKNTEFNAFLCYKRRLYDITNRDIAKYIGVSAPYVYTRLKKPELFTIDDIRRMSKLLHISNEEWTQFI